MSSITTSNTTPIKFIPLLLAAVLIFWGWHIDIWWLGILLAILAAVPNYLSGYWEFKIQEKQRVADLCSLLVLLTGGYLYFTLPRLGDALILTVQWMPVLFFPLLAIQLYSNKQETELSVLFLSLRKQPASNRGNIDLRPLYILVCLLGAAMITPPNDTYYIAISIISAWIFWHYRTKRTAWWRWIISIVLALGIGYSINIGLVKLQTLIEDQVVSLIIRNFIVNTNPYRTTTAIGTVRQLKLSEQIQIRVWPESKLLSTSLLRSNNFTRYKNGIWMTNLSRFKTLHNNIQGTPLLGTGNSKHWIKIAMALQAGKGLLPLPNGSRQLQGLEGAVLTQNVYGVIKISEGPGFAQYRVGYQNFETMAPPTQSDLQVPIQEIPAIDQILQEIQLHKNSPSQVLTQIRKLFQHKFDYSLDLTATADKKRTAIADFLLDKRKGHCEYFATAAVLLLRRAGIPARYAQGWSVQEYSELEQAYVVRSRHAHAWVLVWINDAWHDFDPTPPMWGMLEFATRPWWSWLQDLWSWLWYRLANWKRAGFNQLWLIGGVLILGAFLAWRIVRRGRRAKKNAVKSKVSKQQSEGIFGQVTQVLTRRNGKRRPGETLRNWLQRLQNQGENAVTTLLPALGLYYQQRFDPNGLNKADTQQLAKLITTWLQRYG